MRLEKDIRSVDWQSINLPKSAVDIPDHLRVLVTLKPNTDAWQQAFGRVSSHIAHTGGIYETTLVMVPVLINLLEDYEGDVGWIFDLLGKFGFDNYDG